MMALLRSLRRQPPHSAHLHTTPQEAAQALADGACMYAAVSTCSGRPVPVGLEGDEDMDVVLCCRAHYGRLRQLDERKLNQLRDHLRDGFVQRVLEREQPVG